MNFEWDHAKNDENIRKHYLDFSEAYQIFDGPMLFGTDDRFDYGEVRVLGIGVLRNLVVVIVFTEINDDTIRIISLRKALNKERVKFYEYLRNQLG